MDLATRRDGIREKLRRANEHLLTLTQEGAEFVVTGEYGPRNEFENSIPERDGQAGLTCRADLPHPPPRIAAVCGDVVHNARSALDHLANTLVVANGGTPKEGPGGTQFPISVGGPVDIVVESGPGIAAEAQVLLQEVCPRTETDPLAVLAELSNVDKHRALNVIQVGMLDEELFEFPEELRDRVRQEKPPFANGDLMFSIVTSEADTIAPWMGVSYSGELQFADLPGGPTPLVMTLRRVLDFVRDGVVQRFAGRCLGGKLNFQAE